MARDSPHAANQRNLVLSNFRRLISTRKYEGKLSRSYSSIKSQPIQYAIQYALEKYIYIATSCNLSPRSHCRTLNAFMSRPTSSSPHGTTTCVDPRQTLVKSRTAPLPPILISGVYIIYVRVYSYCTRSTNSSVVSANCVHINHWLVNEP
jgi:hypothetical protein